MYLRNASQWTQGAVINRNLPLALTKKIPQQHVCQIYRFINHPLGSQWSPNQMISCSHCKWPWTPPSQKTTIASQITLSTITITITTITSNPASIVPHLDHILVHHLDWPIIHLLIVRRIMTLKIPLYPLLSHRLWLRVMSDRKLIK